MVGWERVTIHSRIWVMTKSLTYTLYILSACCCLIHEWFTARVEGSQTGCGSIGICLIPDQEQQLFVKTNMVNVKTVFFFFFYNINIMILVKGNVIKNMQLILLSYCSVIDKVSV